MSTLRSFPRPSIGATRQVKSPHADTDAERAAVPSPDLAVDSGFYDQSHLVNEFRALCGLTPTEFLARSASGSSKTGASRGAGRGVALELGAAGVASLAVSPGWMRTELVLAGHKTDEAHWRERPALARTESPRYLGRAVAALAADPAVLTKSGTVHLVADLARECGFTDVDGRQPEAFEIDGA
ncbi:SDR family oxidoreductase [Piscinibacter sp.]|uniref:SDR family oxidoreductase n=1 Tax=Piscinibacter sp. TaxID=1903157 RepID=UPI002BA1F0E5|nr:SDR family oxidoreductase [Albitalea sp.]HUG25993.1 SDR family oxidoreductase [Albitalea sp.]